MSFGGAGFLLYVATAPDVAINILGLTATQFGWLFLPIVSGLIIGSAVSGKAAGKIPPLKMVQIGFTLMATGALLNVLSNLFCAQRVPWAMLPVTVFTFGCALMGPIATLQSLDLFPTHKGLASSLQGFSQIMIFALISGFAARFVYRSGVKHAVGMAILMSLSWLAYRGFLRFAGPRPSQ